MSKPTEAQVRALEVAHKQMFVYLVLANHLWIKIYKELVKRKANVKGNPLRTSWINLGNKINDLAQKWIKRQLRLEVTGGVQKFDPYVLNYFLRPAYEKKLMATAAALLSKDEAKKAGIGIIPLIIWAVIVIVGAVSAYFIIDELTTTAQEKEELMKQTQTTLDDLGIKGDAAAAIINSTQAQASAPAGSGFLSSLTLPLLAVAGVFLFMNHKSKA